MHIDEILELAMRKGASDVHLKAGIVPVIRKHGLLRPLANELEPLDAAAVEEMAQHVMDESQMQHFLQNREIDIGYGVSGLGRFRFNIFFQRGSIRMVIRNIPHRVPTFEDLSLPPVVEKIAANERGLILVTGITGSGKSSTLAAMLDYINRTTNNHIITIEDPIEFLIRDRKSIVSQRELGTDTTSFAKALRAALRQDPDVILIGEMRDKETTEIAITAAETGHLVLSSLHTSDAQETINRIVAQFDGNQQLQIRMQLSSVLTAILGQRLARRKDKAGFIPAVEILVNNGRIKEMIEDPTKTSKIKSAIEEGHVAYGMQSFDQSLTQLVRGNLVEYEEALRLSTNPDDFALRFKGISNLGEKGWDTPQMVRSVPAAENRDLADQEIEMETTRRHRK